HRLTVGLDLTREDNQSITNRMDDYQAQYYSASAALGSKSVNRRDVTYNTYDYNATLTFPVGDNLESQTSGGLQYYRNFTRLASANGREFPVPGLKTLNAAAVTFGGDNYYENTTVGMFVQQMFSWANRRFLTVAL